MKFDNVMKNEEQQCIGIWIKMEWVPIKNDWCEVKENTI